MYKIVQPRKRKNLLMLMILSGFFTVTVIVSYLLTKNSPITISLVIAFFISCLLMFIVGNNEKSFKIIGNLQITNDKIRIKRKDNDNIESEFRNIKVIKAEIENYKNKKHYTSNGVRYHAGNGNKIEFVYNGDVYFLDVYIENKLRMKQLRNGVKQMRRDPAPTSPSLRQK